MSIKAQLRSKYRAIRDGLNQADRDAWSDRIRSHALELPELAAAQSVFVYASAGSEAQTYNLIEGLFALGKTVAVPRITDQRAGQMQAVVIDSLKDLVPDPANASFGLLVPRGKTLLVDSPDVTFLPGLAFSPTTGTRLGVGGGFYDRYLAAHPHTHAAALCFDCQLAEDLPAEPHDQVVQALVTESRRITVSR